MIASAASTYPFIATFAEFTNSVVAIAVFAVSDGIVGERGIPVKLGLSMFALNCNPDSEVDIDESTYPCIAKFAEFTNAVVAIAVFAVPEAIVGAVGLPVNAGLNNVAFNISTEST